MGTLWREYGLITVLLVFSVGGYLYLSESDEDLIGNAVQSLSAHLLALVPEEDGRIEALAALSLMEEQVTRGEMRPEQMERLAANIMNLRTSGASLDGPEAEMMVRMAMDEPELLPSPVSDAARPALAAAAPSPAEMEAAAGRVQSMFQLFDDVQKTQAVRTSAGAEAGPSMRFYADGGLTVVLDERLQREIGSATNVRRGETDKRVRWQARLAESIEADKARLMAEASGLTHMSIFALDSLDQNSSRQLDRLARFMRLRAGGVMVTAEAESLASRALQIIERELEVHVGASAAAATSPPKPPRSSN
ncbi:MAG: hypothetical protein ACI9W4_000591 [Rhodothermales bacterium]|jgi:hypothetical protein